MLSTGQSDVSWDVDDRQSSKLSEDDTNFVIKSPLNPINKLKHVKHTWMNIRFYLRPLRVLRKENTTQQYKLVRVEILIGTSFVSYRLSTLNKVCKETKLGISFLKKEVPNDRRRGHLSLFTFPISTLLLHPWVTLPRFLTERQCPDRPRTQIHDQIYLLQ